jgi:DNA polymerase I-like protein with 3'-5' exonuclease and polymerase domains
MSCADPNMQNQPRDDLRLRYNIKAPEGYKLVTCDLSNIEMRLFAAYAGPGRLLNLIRSDDADVHTFTAKALGITDRVRAGGWVETARQRAKVFNFSVIYGGGFRTIRRQQRCDMAEARRLKQRYYDTFPEVRTLQERIEQTLASRGYITDPLRPQDSRHCARGLQVRQLPRPGHGGRDSEGGARLLPQGRHPCRRSDSRRDHRCVPEAEAESTRARSSST